MPADRRRREVVSGQTRPGARSPELLGRRRRVRRARGAVGQRQVDDCAPHRGARSPDLRDDPRARSGSSRIATDSIGTGARTSASSSSSTTSCRTSTHSRTWRSSCSAASCTGRSATPGRTSCYAAVGLDLQANVYPPELSGGERQRIAVARALANDPAIVLADEPTGSLDDDTARLVIDLLRVHCDRGGAVLAVSHDPRLTSAADRVLQLVEGRIVPGNADAGVAGG